MAPLFYLLATAAVMHAVRGFAVGEVVPGAGTALTLGYILISAFFAGQLFARLRLPRLTGYLVAGLLAGPYGLELLRAEELAQLRIFTSVAVALIAIGAGAELSIKEMRPLARAILAIAACAVPLTVLLLAGAAFALRGWLPFLAERGALEAAALALTVGVVLSAQSPAVALALRAELAAQGVVSATVLGLVVVGDVGTIVLFSFAAAAAQAVLGGETEPLAVALRLAWELLGSIGAGLVVGLLLLLFLRILRQGTALFVVATCLLVGEVSTPLHLEPVLVGLAAGALVRNVGRDAERLHAAVTHSQVPVFVIFFGTAGAGIHLDALGSVAAPALALVAVRALGLLGGSQLGARLAHAPRPVVAYAGFGMLPQAGLAIALALMFERQFPQLGKDATALALAVVAINELVSPALYRSALVRAGEAGRDAAV